MVLLSPYVSQGKVVIDNQEENCVKRHESQALEARDTTWELPGVGLLEPVHICLVPEEGTWRHRSPRTRTGTKAE